MLVAQISLYLFNLQILPAFKRSLLIGLVFAIQVALYLYTKEKNYYQIYGISRTFTPGELKQAQKAIMLQYHPDKNPDSTLELFDAMRSINDVLKNDLVIYNTYGPFQRINNNDPLPQLVNKATLERVLIYLLMLMGTSVQTSSNEGKSAKKLFFLVLGLGFFVDYWLYADPQIQLISDVFPQLALFEFILIFRAAISIMLSSFLVSVKTLQSQRKNRLINLDLDELKRIEEDHQKYIESSNSWKSKAGNAIFYLFAIGLCYMYFMDL